MVLSDRFGLYAVTATLVSGLAEAALILLAPVLFARLGSAHAIGVVSASGAFSLLALPALGRAFSALFLRETGGSAPVVLLVETLRALGVRFSGHDPTVLPLTRAAFWERLERADTVTAEADGSLLYRGLLPHLTWTRSHRLGSGGDYWLATPERPLYDRGRLIHSYRLRAMADPPSPGTPPPQPPPAGAYMDEVLAGVRREWDDWNLGFAWVTSLLAKELQARAFDHRGGPGAARRATLWTSGLSVVAAAYVLSFLPGPPGDPLGPILGLLAVLLLADAVARLRAVKRGLYAPSLIRFVLPSDLLRPERVAYHAHRDAERRILQELYPSR